MTDENISQPEEYSKFDQCLDGAKVGSPIGAMAGGAAGARYGFRTGAIGAFGTGGLLAPLTIAGATVLGGTIGAGGGGIVGGIIGCAANIKLHNEINDIPAPMSTPKPLNPGIPVNRSPYER